MMVIEDDNDNVNVNGDTVNQNNDEDDDNRYNDDDGDDYSKKFVSSHLPNINLSGNN